MRKKGQLTFMVIAGLVILVVIAGVLLGRQRAVPPTKLQDAEIEDVKAAIQSCVDQTFEDGIAFLGGGGYSDYEDALEDYVILHLPLCVDFSQVDVSGLEITPTGEVEAAALLKSDRSSVSLVVQYPVTLRKGANEIQLSAFSSEHPFIQSNCLPVPVDAQCRATQDKTVEVLGILWTFNAGDEVRVGATCVAC